MHPRTIELQRHIDDCRATLTAAFDAVPGALRERRPGAGRWSVAGVLGPVLVNYARQYQIDHGVEKAQAYNVTMRAMAVLLVVGFILNSRVRPLDPAKMHAPD